MQKKKKRSTPRNTEENTYKRDKSWQVLNHLKRLKNSPRTEIHGGEFCGPYVMLSGTGGSMSIYDAV
jgi:hypothetical protein